MDRLLEFSDPHVFELDADALVLLAAVHLDAEVAARRPIADDGASALAIDETRYLAPLRDHAPRLPLARSKEPRRNLLNAEHATGVAARVRITDLHLEAVLGGTALALVAKRDSRVCSGGYAK